MAAFAGGKMKDNLPFFSHDNNARRHPKMKALIAEYGFEGYGRFWALNERIAESSGAFIDISKKVNKLDLASELGLDGKGLDSFLAFLSDPEIDLINLEDNVITTDRVTELFNKTIENREYERDRKKEKKEKSKNPAGNNVFPDGNNGFPDGITAENDTDKTRQDNTKQDNTKQDHGESDDSPLPEIAIELAELLLTEHRKEIPDYLSGKSDREIMETIKRWAADIDKLIRIDKKAPENIRQVILWAKTPGNFWFHNIESGAKLRKQYERLWGQMNEKRFSQGPPLSAHQQQKISLSDLEGL